MKWCVEFEERGCASGEMMVRTMCFKSEHEYRTFMEKTKTKANIDETPFGFIKEWVEED